jgi:mannose-6-phosphate isomerase-like protein (cupin superfamily)
MRMRTWGALVNSEQFGYHRTAFTRLQGPNVAAAIDVLLFGQSAPPHAGESPLEHIIFQLEGETEWAMTANPTESFRLEPHDMLYIPARMEYEYSNVGRGDAWFLSVTANWGEIKPTM